MVGLNTPPHCLARASKLTPLKERFWLAAPADQMVSYTITWMVMNQVRMRSHAKFTQNVYCNSTHATLQVTVDHQMVDQHCFSLACGFYFAAMNMDPFFHSSWLSCSINFNHIFPLISWLSCGTMFNNNCFSALQNNCQKIPLFIAKYSPSHNSELCFYQMNG